MSTRHLEYLFRPRSVAVVGASTRPRSIGNVVMRNLLAGGFQGPILPVNPKYGAVGGVLAYRDLRSLPQAPDLAVICTPADTVSGLVEELGALGTRAAIVMTAGLDRRHGEESKGHWQATLEAAQPHAMRILGPNCLGLMAPPIGLDATFAHVGARAGSVAFVSQSGALCTAVLDWAQTRGIGFSAFVSLGEAADIDFADIVDYLAGDGETRSILLYIESVRSARKFLSATRAAARSCFVIALKSGRSEHGQRAAASHTGALAGRDAAYDAVLRRAGVLRVDTVDELFEAAETLAREPRLRGERLGILSNGGGPAVLAVDALARISGELAVLSEGTVAALDEVLPPTWPRANPVDIIGDAPPERYGRATEILCAASEVDALLVMHSPTAVASSDEAARAVAQATRAHRARVWTCWLGDASARIARRELSEAGLPVFETPNRAVRAFGHVVEYQRNRRSLMQTPPSVPTDFSPDPGRARAQIELCLSAGRSWLDDRELTEVLDAYGIAQVGSRFVAVSEGDFDATVDLLVETAKSIGYPVVLKVQSQAVLHKSDVGGVLLDLASEPALRAAADAVRRRLASVQPAAPLEGFVVQPMVKRPGAHELLIGVVADPTFGPLIVFGHGGTAVEVLQDRAIGLPPLNPLLAREVVDRTRISRLLRGYRDRLPVDLEALDLTLVRIAQMAVDLPGLVELDLNPVLADADGLLVLDARLRVQPAPAGTRHLAIRPYPKELEEVVRLPAGDEVTLRPIRPEDEAAHFELFRGLSPESIYFRFFGIVREMPHEQLARYTQIDYDREMAFIACRERDLGTGERREETLGVVRLIFDRSHRRAEFAILVRSDIQRQGLGRLLLEKTIRYAQAQGTESVLGQVLAENHRMLRLARELGFSAIRRDGNVIEVELVV